MATGRQLQNFVRQSLLLLLCSSSGLDSRHTSDGKKDQSENPHTRVTVGKTHSNKYDAQYDANLFGSLLHVARRPRSQVDRCSYYAFLRFCLMWSALEAARSKTVTTIIVFRGTDKFF